MLSFSFQGLSLLNANDMSAYFLPLFHGYHGYPMLRNILAIIKRLMYHHLPGLCSKTMVFQDLQRNFGSRVWFACSFFKSTTWSSRNRSTLRPLLQLGNALLIFVTLPLNRMRVRPRHRGHARSQSYDSYRIRKSGFKESCRQLVLVDTSFAGFSVYWPSLVWFWQ